MASESHGDAFSQAHDEPYSYDSSQAAFPSSSSSDASRQTTTSSLEGAAPASPSSTEPQWTFNRRSNAINSNLCRLPNEILMDIMISVSEDRVSLYLLRQVCHRFADLFSSPTFNRFHEREFSLILGRNKHRVELDSLPLTAFRARMIDVAFSTHTWRARRILMRDFKSRLVENTCPDTSEARVEKQPVAKMLSCDYCVSDSKPQDAMHRSDQFPPSERKVSDEYMRACDSWFGNINACNHCTYHGALFQVYRREKCDVDNYAGLKWGHEDTASECLWECQACFNDLCPDGVDIKEACPITERPQLRCEESGESSYHQFVVTRQWTMPLFCNNEVGTVITRSEIQQRLKDLSEGPYEDLIRLSLGPFASFRDEAFLTHFGEDIDTSKGVDYDWGRVEFSGNPDVDWNQATEMGWTFRERSLYLSFEQTIWVDYQEMESWFPWYDDSDEDGSDDSE